MFQSPVPSEEFKPPLEQVVEEEIPMDELELGYLDTFNDEEKAKALNVSSLVKIMLRNIFLT